jgi:RNA polymerase sigma-70 factor (ECF subfamily)
LLVAARESTLTGMAVAQPESKRESVGRPPADDGADDVAAAPVAAAGVAGSRGVNRGATPPSNAKEVRAREAEEDRALIAKAQAGDTAAFRSLVERHQRRAFAIAYSLVRDEHDARELVQDAFLRVFKGLGTFKGGSSFFTWLYRIVTNLSIDLMRKPGRSPGGFTGLGDAGDKLDASADHDSENLDFPLLSRIDGSDPADVLRRREIAARIQSALDALPPYHRSVIVMREVEGLSYDEMASVMGVSKGTIMSRLFHARQKLQRALYDCYEEQVGAMKVGATDAVPASEASPKADSTEESPAATDQAEGSSAPSSGEAS